MLRHICARSGAVLLLIASPVIAQQVKGPRAAGTDTRAWCEAATDFTHCNNDLSCAFISGEKSCHSRARVPKCEALTDYLCMGRSDCTVSTTTWKCVTRLHHTKFDESPSEALDAKPTCEAIRNADDCYKQFWCQYYNDGAIKRCTTRHTPIVATVSDQKGKSAVNPVSACAQGGCTSITVGKDAHAFHVQWAGKKILLEPLPGDIRVTRLATDEGLLQEMFPDGDMPSVIVRRARGINNAIAIVYRGKRYIVHDSEWSNGNDVTGGGLMVTQLIVAHELGHHICKHSATAGMDGFKQRELEADRVAGAILRKRGSDAPGKSGSLDHIRHVAKQLFDEQASASHPAQVERLAALAEGFRNGHLCHDR
jgi:hypothetical protein